MCDMTGGMATSSWMGGMMMGFGWAMMALFIAVGVLLVALLVMFVARLWRGQSVTGSLMPAAPPPPPRTP